MPRGEYRETYLKPLSREEARDLTERMFWKKLQLFDEVTGSQECIESIYEAAVKERDNKGLKIRAMVETPPTYIFSTKPMTDEEKKRRKEFNLPTLVCLLETAKECPTTPNRNALRDYLVLYPDKAMEFCEGVRAHPEIGDTCKQYLSLHAILVEHNRLLAKNIAKKEIRDLDYEGRIEAGERGLMIAGYKFSVWEGFRFSTYATWWIKQAIRREAKTSKVVTIPIYAQYEQKNRRWLPKEISLDYASKDQGLAGCMEDKKIPNPEEQVAREMLENDVARILTRISLREADILRMRYGIGQDPMTLKEIGDKIHLSRERVRQIEGEALRKLSIRAKVFAEAV